jgi:hypothetical protein
VSTAFFSQYLCFLCWKAFWTEYRDIFGRKSKDWVQLLQDAITHRGFLCDQSTWFDSKFFDSSCRSKRETVARVPHGSSPCWDHRSEKVTEHQSCQSSHVNGATELPSVELPSVGVIPLSLFPSCHGVNFGRNSFQRTVGVNLAAFCLLLSCHGLNFGKNYFQILCTGPGIP